MREVSVEGLMVLGTGTTAIVYAYEDDKIIKVYNDGWPLAEITKEKERTEAVYSMGVNCPKVYEIVKVGTGYGMIYERVSGDSMLSVVKSIGEENRGAELREFYADLISRMKSIHAVKIKAGVLPDIKEFYLDKINNVFTKYLEKSRISQMKDIVNSAPDTVSFVHGDLNVSNIAKEANGKIMDVADACQGDPIFDINIYPAFCYLGRYNASVFQKNGMNEAEIRALTDAVFEGYYGDLPEADKLALWALYWKLGAVRLFISIDAAGLLSVSPPNAIRTMETILDETVEY